MTISPVLEHPILESCLGGVPLHSGRVVQFRGMKFGEFVERNAKSTMVELCPAEIDCTENRRKGAPVGLTQGKFECLNLVITVPGSALNSSDAEEVLPVFIRIHGGANKWISSSAPLIDMANFVSRSVDIGILIVGGVLPGSLSAYGGFLDQRLALKWVRKHICGFRGDPDMVTVGGNSAGSFAAEIHLNVMPGSNSKGLFNRAAMQSVTLRVSNSQPQSWGIDLSEKIAKKLGADVEKEGWEGVPKTAPARDVVAAIEKDGFDFLPLTEDGGYFTKGWGEAGAAVSEWYDALLIGDADFDGSIFILRVRLVPPEDLIAAFRSLGSLPVTKSIHDGTLQFLSDLLISFSSRHIATTRRSGNKEVCENNYDRPNPWGPQNRRAHHTAEMPSLFGNYAFPGETHEAATEGEAMGYGPAGRVGVGWKKDMRKVRAWEVMEGLSKAELVRAYDIVGGCMGHL
ncbi:alpha/beta-hydrolase [Tuber magnatum]|uniref:Carboxylic ester hydrolase n=1 Tax=Tuber magnatum TaxID=42249 RepID=A0A317T2N5_9PEZI|nr:alpha/beta-hydrolase [Tuber magnatum]